MNKCWLLLFGCLAIGCTHSGTTCISGRVVNAPNEPVLYFQSHDGCFDSQTVDTLPTQSDGSFTLSFPAEQIRRLRFLLPGKGVLGSITVGKGNHIVEIDATAEYPIRTVDSSHMTQISQMLSRLDRDVFNFRCRRSDRFLIARDTVAESVGRKLREQAIRLESAIGSGSSPVQTQVRQDIRMQLLLAFQVQYFNSTHAHTADSAFCATWFKELDRMNDWAAINHPASPFSTAFYDAVAYDSGIRYYNRKMERPKEAHSDLELKYIDFESRLSGQAREAALAQLLLEDALYEQYNPIIPTLTERFLRLHPHSTWEASIRQAADANTAFNSIEIPESIHFPSTEQFRSFDEFYKLFPGRVVYIDIWATWCGSCREAFAHLGALREYARQHDVVLLYLSIDKTQDDGKWRRMAARYNLEGEHVRVGEKFHQELANAFGNGKGSILLPHYAIIDRKGKILHRTAASPKEFDKLKEQLDSIVDKRHN